MTADTRVLVVEDEDPVRELLTVTLEGAGYQVLEAGDAEQAKQVVGDLSPDLMLLDWMLPGMNGLELLATLRDRGGCAEVPALALSADAMPEQVARGLEAGFARYLTKPIDLEELESAIAVNCAAA